MNKWVSLILVVVLAGAGGAGWYLKQSKTPQKKYQTEPVSVGDLKQTVTATGQLNPVINVQVGSQISGNIQKLFADFNSPVKAGQVVAQLDPSISQAMMHQAEGDLKSAKASLELASLTAERKKKLVEQKTAPQADLDSALAALHQAEASVQIKEAYLEKTKADLDHCTIYSPIDGIVISRSVDVGQTVAASMNAPVLFTIANDLHNMQIDAAVAEGDVGTVEVGQNVDFSVDAYPYRVFHGKVTQVRNAPTTVQNVVTYDAVIAVNNSDLKLKPGMTANISINIAQREGVLKIPNAALRFRLPEDRNKSQRSSKPPVPGGGDSGTAAAGAAPRQIQRGGGRPTRTVYVLEGESQKPVSVQIKVGIGDGISTEVVEGLKEGQNVVTGSLIPTNSAPAGANPFGGGMRRF